MDTQELSLSGWQRDFVTKFAASTTPWNTLVAGFGQGKTTASIHAASAKLKSGQAKKVAFISDHQSLTSQWVDRLASGPIVVDRPSRALFTESSNGAALTFQQLEQHAIHDSLMGYASTGELLLIVDEADRYQVQAVRVADMILDLNASNQVLLISRMPLAKHANHWKYQIDGKFHVDSECIFEPETLILPSTQILLAEHSPSLTILSRLQRKIQTLDQLGWRDFEILISELLAFDGYEIELMRGTKDGGVDVVAVKDLGETGMFKALWQAKKNRASRKVGISTIKELADVRNEHKASKAILVTTSFLTHDALKRVERDRYWLGKVDRNDLDAWIDRTLHG
ncbi:MULTISPECIES: restriction endonuclease [unclassified Pseudomonas]|uniref:restriction endonuclease n=1 Tax=unclassified Pseudomonas TaxID=196821 RepID=UPI00111C0646|nr:MULTISPECIES: restriction endonuclease [unclassified Pseudomonas]